MKIDILTLFPNMFKGPFDESIIKRAQEKGLVEINIHNLRKWAMDKHKTVDDKPFGGGVGMVMKVEPVYRALKELRSQPPSIPPYQGENESFRLSEKDNDSRTSSNLPQNYKDKKENKTKKIKNMNHDSTYPPDKGGLRGVNHSVILMTPQGKKLEQDLSNKFSTHPHLIIICGHYEGIDERIRTNLVDYEISIGDYILTGGELPAMVLIDSVARLIPGVVGKEESVRTDSFQKVDGKTLLEYPQYTQPSEFVTDEGERWTVPEILLSGHHANIEKWRAQEAIKRTKERRPDLLD